MNENYILNDNELFCKNCYFRECRCKNLAIINRRHDYLFKTIDMNKMETYFGILDTDYSCHSITLARVGRFRYILSIKKLNIYNPLTTYIKELPRDINTVIYSYLSDTNFIMKINIRIPYAYPFDSPVWTVLHYVKDGKSQNRNEETKNARCLLSHSSPSLTLEKEILIYVSSLLDH
jgi:uncharacterized protein YkuJ